jgi:putative endonuclease
MTEARQRLGRRGEDVAAEWLRELGYALVARNARTAAVRGELDLIAIDGRALVFVEVKTLSVTTLAGPEVPALAVGARKRARLRALAIAWLRENRGSLGGFAELRFDVVGIRLDGGGKVRDLEHLRAAF